MTPSVAIIAPGAMGSAVARRLHDNGLRVITSLEGRSPESAKRASAAGMADVARAELAQADILLSIVPPGSAVALAEEMAAAFATAAHKPACAKPERSDTGIADRLRSGEGRPLYVDCNALNLQTAARVADIVHAGGMNYVDAGIIGGPPKRGYDGPVLYLSGEGADKVLALRDFGIDCRVLNGGAFAASALKMSYAGITKGLTALASMMIIGAANAGTADALRAELAHSQPALLAWLERQVPSMFPKAYRWIAEMEEIAAFAEPQPDAEALFHAVAGFYTRIADPRGAPDVKILSGFFAGAKPAQ